MEVGTEVSVQVRATPGDVFDYLTRLETPREILHGVWPVPDVVGVEVVTGDGTSVGSVRRVHVRGGGAVEEQLTVVERPSCMAYAVLRGIPFPFNLLLAGGRGTFDLVGAGATTVILWRFRFRVTTPWVWPLALPLVRIFHRRFMRRGLENLRRRIGR